MLSHELKLFEEKKITKERLPPQKIHSRIGCIVCLLCFFPRVKLRKNKQGPGRKKISKFIN